jgi:hypothetical protein
MAFWNLGTLQLEEFMPGIMSKAVLDLGTLFLINKLLGRQSVFLLSWMSPEFVQNYVPELSRRG